MSAFSESILTPENAYTRAVRGSVCKPICMWICMRQYRGNLPLFLRNQIPAIYHFSSALCDRAKIPHRGYRYATGLSEYKSGRWILGSSPVFPRPVTFSDVLSVISATSTHGVALTPVFTNHSPSSQFSSSPLSSPEKWGQGNSVGQGMTEHCQLVRKSPVTREPGAFCTDDAHTNRTY